MQESGKSAIFVDMKMHSALILTLVCIALAVGSCGNARYDSRLLAADSIINSAPDSALSMLRAVPQAEIPSAADRAFYALLVTQAGYKCDEPIKSTDTIDRAIKYFTDSRDREKRTRSLIYKGAVLDELGDKTAAMLWYKQAEEAAAPHDYFNLGYVNLRMASLYRKVYAESELHIDKYKKAYGYYRLANDTAYQLKCLNYIGPLYRASNQDSAYHYIFKAIDLAKKYGDKESVVVNSAYLARTYETDSLYEKEKLAALYALKNDSANYLDDYYNECCYDLCNAYVKLGNPDSAKYYFNSAKPSASMQESVSRYLAESNLKYSCGEYKEAFDLRDRASVLAHKLETTSGRQIVFNTETLIDKHREEVKNLIYVRNLIIVGFVLLLICLIFLMLLRRNKLKQQHLLEQISQMQTNILDVIEQDLEKESLMNDSTLAYFSKADQLVKLYHSCKESPHALHTRMVKIINDEADREQFWNTIHRYLNSKSRGGLLDKFRKEYPKLKIPEINVACLVACGFSNILISIYMGYGDAHYVYNKKKMIAKKMGIATTLDSFLTKFFA